MPHSGISGSKDVCSSPKLFAAYRALLRYLVPRHPPFALTILPFYIILLPFPSGSRWLLINAFSFRFFVYFLLVVVLFFSSYVNELGAFESGGE